MIDIKTFKLISKEARESMKKGSDGETITHWKYRLMFISLFNILPILIAFAAYYNDLMISSIENYIGTVISIFTGLFFSLLLGIGDKVRNEKNNEDKDVRNLYKYRQNMKQISNIILYVILLGLEIFILLLLNSFFGEKLNGCIEVALTVIISYLLTRYVLSLLFVIQRFYYTTRDEIGNIL